VSSAPHPSPFAHGRSEIHERKALAQTIRRERRKLGSTLRALRLAQKLTQAAAAEAVGIHAVHIARLEAGTANPTISTLIALAVAYGVPLRALFDEIQA
jgi:DNA-binding XRE family transcriptional regulator